MGYLSDQPTKLIGMVDAVVGTVDHPVCGVLAMVQNQNQSFHRFPLAAMGELLPSPPTGGWQQLTSDSLLRIGEDAHALVHCEDMTTWSSFGGVSPKASLSI